MVWCTCTVKKQSYGRVSGSDNETRPNPEAGLGATELPGSAWSERFLLPTQQGETVKQRWHPLSLRVTLKEGQQQMLQATCQDWQQMVGAAVIDLNWRPWGQRAVFFRTLTARQTGRRGELVGLQCVVFFYFWSHAVMNKVWFGAICRLFFSSLTFPQGKLPKKMSSIVHWYQGQSGHILMGQYRK